MSEVKISELEHNSLKKRLTSMLKADILRMLTSPLLYITVGACILMPILILVMTTLMDGSVSVNPQTGAETVINGFDSAWQAIGSIGGDDSAASMDILAMCNVNMLYFLIAIPIALFVSQDFRSGYSKNIFSVHAKKTDYVISKLTVCSILGALMLLGYLGGTVIGGAVSGLPFDMGVATPAGIALCIVSKILLAPAFAAIYLTVSIAAKQKTWLSLCVSFAVGMLFFMLIPMLSPLNSTAANAVICFIVGAVFSLGLGAVSKLILKKTSLG